MLDFVFGTRCIYYNGNGWWLGYTSSCSYNSDVRLRVPGTLNDPVTAQQLALAAGATGQYWQYWDPGCAVVTRAVATRGPLALPPPVALPRRCLRALQQLPSY